MTGAFEAIRAIAFDFDGVIVDSMPVHSACWQHAVDAVLGAGAEQVSRQIQRNLFGGRAGPAMFEGVGVTEAQRRDLRTHKDNLWRVRVDGVPLMPICKEVLETLARRFPLAIATTARRDYVDAALDREQLSHLFAVIVTGQDVSNQKPAPETLQNISSSLGVPACEIAMVGDTAFDREMAETAGCPFLWFGSPPLSLSHGGGEHPVVTDWWGLADFFRNPISY